MYDRAGHEARGLIACWGAGGHNASLPQSISLVMTRRAKSKTCRASPWRRRVCHAPLSLPKALCTVQDEATCCGSVPYRRPVGLHTPPAVNHCHCGHSSPPSPLSCRFYSLAFVLSPCFCCCPHLPEPCASAIVCSKPLVLKEMDARCPR